MEMFDCPFGIVSEELGTQDWKGRKGTSSHIPSNRSPRAATWGRRVPRASHPHPVYTARQHPLGCWSSDRKQTHGSQVAQGEGTRGSKCVTRCLKLQWICLGKFRDAWLRTQEAGALYPQVSQPIGLCSAALCWAHLCVAGLCCSRTCSLGQKALGDGADTTFLFQVEATLLKMHDSWNNLPSAPSCLILSCSSPPAHKTFQHFMLLPFALPSAHSPGCQVRICAQVLQKYGFFHLCHPHNRWTG